MKDTNDLYVTDAHNIVVPPPVLMTVAPLDWLDQLTTATARVAKLERANAGHHTLEDTQVEVIRDLQEKLKQANTKAGHHALGDVQIENIADDYERDYRKVKAEHQELEYRLSDALYNFQNPDETMVEAVIRLCGEHIELTDQVGELMLHEWDELQQANALIEKLMYAADSAREIAIADGNAQMRARDALQRRIDAMMEQINAWIELIGETPKDWWRPNELEWAKVIRDAGKEN